MAVNDTPSSANDERKQKNQKKVKKHKKVKSKQAIMKNVRRIHYRPLLFIVNSFRDEFWLLGSHSSDSVILLSCNDLLFMWQSNMCMVLFHLANFL